MFTTIIVLALVLGLLIFAHEFGHYYTAKKSGIKVEEFGFGFPPRIWAVKKGETEYSINWIPLGGFVKIKGENGEQRNEPDSFGYQSFGKRVLVLSAGVLMNIFVAFILLSIGFAIGLPSAVTQEDIDNNRVTDLAVQVAAVVDNSPAQEIGLEPGDKILKMNGQEMDSVEELQSAIAQNGSQEASLEVKKLEGEVVSLQFTPREIANFAEGNVLGVSLMQVGFVKYGFFESWYKGLIATFEFLIMIIIAFFHLFKDLFTGGGLSKDVAGPVGVAIITGQMVNLGYLYVLRFTALLSLNLAVLNFIPFPALDGGRVLFLLIEKIRRKPNNLKVENAFNNIGFSLLMLFVVFITFKDIAKHSGGLIEFFKNLF